MIVWSSFALKRRRRRRRRRFLALIVMLSSVAGLYHIHKRAIQHLINQSSLDDALVILRNGTYHAALKATQDEVQKSSSLTEATRHRGKKKKQPVVVHPPYDGPLSRAFPKYPRELPCIEDNRELGKVGANKNDPAFHFTGVAKEGMFYTKLSKCSSSTLAGVAVQIARNTAARRNLTCHCLVAADHGSYRQVVKQRDKSRSMLWTFIREPAARQVSDYFHFQVSRGGADPKDMDNFKKQALVGLRIVEYMTGYVFGRMDNVTQKVAYVMDRYDFIGLVERYHESLILLKLIFNLELRDILYTSAKRSGGFDDGEWQGKCYYIQPSVVTPSIRSWFQTNHSWNTYAEPDILLYRVVNASLDLTIDLFGRQKVEHQVEVLRQALEYADAICGPTAVYPCSSTGHKRIPRRTTCISHDWACAYKCLETLDLDKFETLLANSN